MVEADFPAYRWHAETIAITADTRDDSVDERFGFRVFWVAERQRVHSGNWACAHGEYIAQNPAHARGRALERFDEGRVVVAFHFEGNAEVVADVYDTRVFAGAADDLCARGGQGGKPFFRGFVRAVFVPHGREYAELCIGGRAVYGF